MIRQSDGTEQFVVRLLPGWFPALQYTTGVGMSSCRFVAFWKAMRTNKLLCPIWRSTW